VVGRPACRCSSTPWKPRSARSSASTKESTTRTELLSSRHSGNSVDCPGTHVAAHETHQRSLEFLFCTQKRLFQQNRTNAKCRRTLRMGVRSLVRVVGAYGPPIAARAPRFELLEEVYIMRTLAFAIASIVLGGLQASSASELNKSLSIMLSKNDNIVLITCDTNAARQCQRGANACYSRCGNGTGDLYKRCRDHCLS